MKFTHSFLEGLEPRIAPAGLVTFHDVDGDLVTVKSSKGTSADLTNALTISDAGQLEKVDFTSAIFKNTALDIKVTQRDPSTGDGFVNVGLMDATGNDLGSVSIKGDLGKILAGDNNISSNGINTIKVHSMGAKGISTQGDAVLDPDLRSVIVGRSNSFTVDTSITDASITYTNQTIRSAGISTHENTAPSTPASIGYITIGNNLIGTTGDLGDGSITVEGTVSKLQIGGNIVGGDGAHTGSITANALGNVSVGGSVTGGGGSDSGAILSVNGVAAIKVGGNLTGEGGDGSGRIELDNVRLGGTIFVGGNLVGGDGQGSGAILSFGTVAKVTLGGNLIGGDGIRSGVISNHSTGLGDNLDSSSTAINISALSIGGNIIGGSGENSANVFVDNIGTFALGGGISGANNGSQNDGDGNGAAVFNTATSITLGGNVTGGDTKDSGSIIVFENLQTFSMKGSVFGGGGDDSGNLFLTVAKGTLKSTIGGSVIGGGGFSSGVVDVGGAGTNTLAIGGKVQGGSGDGSADIYAENDISSLIIGGSVIGGGGDGSGSLVLTGGGSGAGLSPACSCPDSNVLLKTLSIGGSVTGGDGLSSGNLILNNVGTLTIGGELSGGSGDNSGSVSGAAIANVSIGQDIIGGDGLSSGGIFYISGTSFSLGGSIIGGNDGGASGFAAAGTLTSVDIGGSIIGGDADGSGNLSLGGFVNLGHANTSSAPPAGPLTITIGGDIIGGSGDGSGDLTTAALVGPASLTVGGKLAGGQGEHSGVINSNTLASLSIGGDVTGGSGDSSGSITAGDSSGVVIKNVTIGGSLIGGSGSNTGAFSAANDHINTFNILGDVRGGLDDPSSPDPVTITNSGFITAGTIDTLHAGGSLVAGTGADPNDLNNGAIRVGMLGTLNVDGSIEGTEGNSFLITAQGNLSATAKTNLAIGAVNVLGDVDYANILAGYDTSGTTLNGNGGDNGGTAQIGNVHVSGDWHAASLTAGTNTGESDQWGTDTNFLLTKPTGSSLIASIASIQIDGIASGYTDTEGSEAIQNGFVAKKIGNLNVAGETYTIPPAPGFVQVGPNPALVAELVTPGLTVT